MNHRFYTLLFLSFLFVFYDSSAQTRRVVLTSNKSFSSQVTTPNTIYIIQNDYDLSGKDVCIPPGCTLVFDGGIIRNGKVNFNGAALDGYDYTRFVKITLTGAPSTAPVYASWFGFNPGKGNTMILKNLLKYCTIVLIKDGEYQLDDTIIVDLNDAICELRGETRKNTKLVFNGVDGIRLYKGIHLCNMLISGKNCIGRWDSSMNCFVNGHSGIDIRKGGQILHDLDVYSFMTGLNISEGNVITGSFERIVLAYNSNYGLYLKHKVEAQKNNLRFIALYCVKCGHDADNLTSFSTGLHSGHGIYISGGYGNTFDSCVTEYNTGCGIFIDLPSNSSPLKGNAFISTYFERNKFANNYIKVAASSTMLNNLSFSSSFYSEGGNKPVADACKSRTVVIEGADFLCAGKVDSPSVSIDEVIELSKPQNKGVFFTDYSCLGTKVKPRQFAISSFNGKNVILIDNNNKTIGSNKWMSGSIKPGTYSVYLNARNIGGKPVTLVIQLKAGSDSKVYQVTIASPTDTEYILGKFKVDQETEVTMTGTYVLSPNSGSYSIGVSALDIIPTL